jgi:hypothetical protein
MDPQPAVERRPRNLRDFDFHHEKIALTRMAHWLIADGWSEVKLSVPPRSIEPDRPLVGEDPLPLDDAFVQRFNTDWRYRYNFYRDQPGNYDLVARRGSEMLVVEGKGQSAGNKRGAVQQMVGGLSLQRDLAKGSWRYALLIPEGSVWDRALTNHGGLDWLELYRIEADPPGNIRGDAWAAHASS